MSIELERTPIIDNDGGVLYEEIHYDDDVLIKQELEGIREKIDEKEVDINIIKQDLKDKRIDRMNERSMEYIEWLYEYTDRDALPLCEKLIPFDIEEFIDFLNKNSC